jgi:surface antigen
MKRKLVVYRILISLFTPLLFCIVMYFLNSPGIVTAFHHDNKLQQFDTKCYNDICVKYNLNDVGSISVNLVDSAEEAGMPIPEHIQFWFTNYPLSVNKNFTSIDLFPNTSVDSTSIESVLLNHPVISTSIFNEIPGPSIPREPFPHGNAMLSMVAKFKYIETPYISGYRYIGQYGQCVCPYSPSDFLYIFQGLSTNGQYAISAKLAVQIPITPDLSIPEGIQDNDQIIYEYNQLFANLIEQSVPEGFSPSLNSLDDLIQSFTIGSIIQTPPIEELANTLTPTEISPAKIKTPTISPSIDLKDNIGEPLPKNGYEPADGFLEQIFKKIIPPVNASDKKECQNRFKEKNCTWFVARQRSDVCLWIDPGEGNAYQWVDEARENGGEYGVMVRDYPEIGDIAVWSQGCGGTPYGLCEEPELACGHVALVTWTSQDHKTMIVQEMNWGIDRTNIPIDVLDCMSFISKPSLTNNSNEPESSSITPTVEITVTIPVPIPTQSESVPSNFMEWLINLLKL